jgi:hypothetical protein
MATSAQELVQQLVESATWKTTSPAGGSIDIQFFADGTGRVGSGLLSREFTWQGQGRRLCLEGLPGTASGCITLTAAEDGFLGQRDDGATIRFW